MNVKLLVHVTRLGKTGEVVSVDEKLGESLITRGVAESTTEQPVIEMEIDGEVAEVELKIEEKPKKKRAKRKKKVVEEEVVEEVKEETTEDESEVADKEDKSE